MSDGLPVAGERYAYLHGFASSPTSRKARALSAAFEARGLGIERPDLSQPSFSKLTYGGALSAVDAMASRHPPASRWCVVGSSMGGWVAARWAELHPDRVRRLVLLCPGFDLPRRWPALLGEHRMEEWRARGEMALPDARGDLVNVHWGFVEEASRHPPYPEVPCPTLIVHGTRDEVVPIATSRAYAAARPRVEIVEVDDDHALGASIDRIAEETLRFFGLGP